MIHRQLKLKLNRKQRAELERWFWHLTSVWNWGVRKIELDANDRVYWSEYDFGAHLLTLSNGEKVEHPREFEAGARRLAQARRGRRRTLVARIHERQVNRRNDRNHKLSRRIVAENQTIVIARDNLRGMARSGFGKSVTSSAHGQLRQMLAYKSRAGGRRYIEVSPINSTRTCSACGSLTGPHGRAGLKVRTWDCGACGAHHDRDVNAAVNTLRAGLGASHESVARRVRKLQS